MNNMNISQMISMLSKMDKKDLSKTMNNLNQILKNENATELIQQIKNQTKNNK